ncbi:MAG: DMT family transporter [Pseudomonadota bacterium]
MTDSPAALPRDRSTLIGLGWMVVTGLMFVAVTGIVRHVGSEIPAVQAAFLRYVFGLILILPVLARLGAWRPSRGSTRLYLWRGLFHGGGVLLWFYAMARIPIAEVTAIGYLAPIFVAIGAAVFFGERLYTRRIAAIVAGLIGAMVILRPGFQEISAGQLAQLGAAPLFAASFLMAKRLTADEDSGVIVAMLSVTVTIVLLPFALWHWEAPTLTELGWLAVTAVFATAGHYTMTLALRAAPITVTQPVTFLQLVWATILGITVFGEPVDPYVLAGGAIIVGAATFISHREAVAARRAYTPPAPATKL